MAKQPKKHKALVSEHGNWTTIETPFFASDPERYGYAETPMELGISPHNDKAAPIGFWLDVYYPMPGKKPKYPYLAYTGQPGAEQEICFPDWPSLFEFLLQAKPLLELSVWTAFVSEQLPTWDELAKRYAGPETEARDRGH